LRGSAAAGFVVGAVVRAAVVVGAVVGAEVGAVVGGASARAKDGQSAEIATIVKMAIRLSWHGRPARVDE